LKTFKFKLPVVFCKFWNKNVITSKTVPFVQQEKELALLFHEQLVRPSSGSPTLFDLQKHVASTTAADDGQFLFLKKRP